jgi:hypothetical protein
VTPISWSMAVTAIEGSELRVGGGINPVPIVVNRW